jgi:phosphoserine phosphatase
LIAEADLVVQAPHVLREDLEVLQLMTGARGIEPLSRASCEAYRLHEPDSVAGIAQACEAASYDFALVPHARTLNRVELVGMDMDSTLITIECIDELGDFAGRKHEVAAITAQAMRGELDYPQSLRKRVALLAGLDESVLERVYTERLRLTAGAEALVAKCKAHGVKLLLVSGGFTFFTERLRARLGLDYTIANRLGSAGGKLTGELLGDVVDADAKAAQFCAVMRELSADRTQAVAIGDGANDLKMMGEAGYSIAFHAKPVVRARASCAIDWCGLEAVAALFE